MERRPHGRPDDGNAFLPDPQAEPGPDAAAPRSDDATAEFSDELAQEFLTAATGNVDVTEQELDRVSETETGGPYVISTAAEEIADDVDGNNPPDATREPFPTPMRVDANVPPGNSR